MSIPNIIWDTTSDRLYSIGEVSKMVKVEQHRLRQWEKHFTALTPVKRISSQKRLYTERDVAIIRRIKVLREHEHMTYRGANTRLNEELNGNPAPMDLQGIRDLADKIADEARAIIHLFDPEVTPKPTEEEEEEEDTDEEENEEEEEEEDGDDDDDHDEDDEWDENEDSPWPAS
ncbi:MAG: hypothetical protein BWX80_00997 [Candidatus Hydrogenedentes bacterium ADurb.Bin101]|nr:MAG: hypothetical protein BWX80_00997 [Candidatus Hydrogenedentes bacterium ADurb.Bin101]